VRAIQRTNFRAKNAKNDLNPTYLVKCNFCFETERVDSIDGSLCITCNEATKELLRKSPHVASFVHLFLSSKDSSR
jgi:hypothetical protein